MKNNEYNQKPEEKLSDCCKAPVRVECGGEGTCHWECTKCEKSCDVVSNQPSPKENLAEKLQDPEILHEAARRANKDQKELYDKGMEAWEENIPKIFPTGFMRGSDESRLKDFIRQLLERHTKEAYGQGWDKSFKNTFPFIEEARAEARKELLGEIREWLFGNEITHKECFVKFRKFLDSKEK